MDRRSDTMGKLLRYLEFQANLDVAGRTKDERRRGFHGAMIGELIAQANEISGQVDCDVIESERSVHAELYNAMPRV